MVASLWGMRSVDDLGAFPFISRTPTDPCISLTCYPPISPVPLISHNFLLATTSLVLYLGQLVRLSSGDWSLSSI